MLIHAKSKWPQEISANLWPYAMRMANEANNVTPNMNDEHRRSPMELFANTRVASNPKHWQHFGCPVYVLDAKLQSGKPFHKWRQRSRLGIYLGRSPQHASSVGLVLNVHTGLTSPQFHIKLDTAFDTIPQVYEGETKHTSLWQLKAGFLTSEKTSRATKSKERANKAQQPETVTRPTAQQVQDISFSPEGDTVPIQKATETQGDSLSGIPQDESSPGAQSRASEKISRESDTRTQEQAQTQSAQQQGPLR
jgi:hypothetical protein